MSKMGKEAVKRNRQRGVTFVELMMVVVIIGILAAFVFPAYQENVRETRRTAAKGQALDLAQALERYRAQSFSYAGVGDCSGNLATLAPDFCSSRFYTPAVTLDADNQGYTITATPKSTMTGDGILVLNSKGDSCWDKANPSTACTPTSGGSW